MTGLWKDRQFTVLASSLNKNSISGALALGRSRRFASPTVCTSLELVECSKPPRRLCGSTFRPLRRAPTSVILTVPAVVADTLRVVRASNSEIAQHPFNLSRTCITATRRNEIDSRMVIECTGDANLETMLRYLRPATAQERIAAVSEIQWYQPGCWLGRCEPAWIK